MNNNRYDLWQNKEYNYSMAFGFIPNLRSYIHDDNIVRPCIIVVPGGGYAIVSETEGEIVAKEFYDKGYNTFVLTYTTNLLGNEPLKLQPINDVSRAIRFVRKNSSDFSIDSDKVFLCGFSAGGHLSASICVHFDDITDVNASLQEFSNRPDGAILSYPVITSGAKAHRGSFDNLIGFNPSDKDLEYMSLEKHVSSKTPPCFIWQTLTDETVPVENSYLFAKALKNNNISLAHHVFSKGRHGLSLANKKWADGDFGTPYTLEQNLNIVDKLKSNDLDVPQDIKERLINQFCFDARGKENVYPEISIWPVLADQWLKIEFGI